MFATAPTSTQKPTRLSRALSGASVATVATERIACTPMAHLSCARSSCRRHRLRSASPSPSVSPCPCLRPWLLYRLCMGSCHGSCHHFRPAPLRLAPTRHFRQVPLRRRSSSLPPHFSSWLSSLFPTGPHSSRRSKSCTSPSCRRRTSGSSRSRALSA